MRAAPAARAARACPPRRRPPAPGARRAGHLLAGSNFKDDQKKVTGGRNGYGAKLANIFSTEFTVETASSGSGSRYKQVWKDNMLICGKPSIKDNAKGEDWTKISFVPDLAKFGMEALDDDIVALMTRRVYDIAGSTRGVKVRRPPRDAARAPSGALPLSRARAPPAAGAPQRREAQGGQLPEVRRAVRRAEARRAPRIFEKCGERWEVCVAASDDGFQQVSFVNSIATSSKEGGTHVKHVTDQVIAKVRETLKKKHKATEKVVKDNQIQSYVKIFVNCLIENPAFSSQTKEKMTLAPGKDCKKFGSSCDLSEKFFKEAVNGCGILEKVLARGMEQHNKTLAKTDGKKKARLTGVAKLDDANEAGGKNGYKCTLIITEGDSAKALAVSGLSVVGRDHYGIFPLRGKLLNVRDAPSTTIANNKEITELKQILGLQQGKDYSDAAALKSLRYGHLMIMTDQDHDGSHIKGLIINFIHCYWPSLLKHTGENAFLREFVTPIVKVKKGPKAQPFFTLKEYNDWTKSVPGGVGGWTIKYYKGLGTSTAAEAKEYFSDLAQHELTFTWEGPQAGACIERAFAKSMVDARKEWLRGYDPDIFVDHSAATLDYTTFIDKELIHFSNADNVRSIPSMVDGLKPGQRKILYACFKRGKSIIKNEIKVAQLAGYVSEHSAYHHGEASLAGTIVGMAQTFVGSNNIALLHPAGQFGTRLLGGKDAASPRYIFTKLPALTRLIFHPHDDAILEYLEDDGQKIEPKWYLPILPMVLVNGAEGIGTGWSSSVPNYNPREIVQNLRRMMDDDAPHPMAPWYRGFNGTITPADARGTYTTYGEVEKSADGKSLHIKELPVKKWTAEYKEGILEPMLAAGDGKAVEKGAEKVELVATDLREHHTDTTVSFTLGLTDEAMAAGEKKGFHKALKLSSTLATSNMTLFDEQSRIAKYDAAEEVLTAFYTLRLGYYGKRKQYLVDELTAAWTKLDNKMRFVNAVVSGALKIANRKKADLVAQLVKDGYVAFEPAAKKKKVDGDASDDDDGADDAAEDRRRRRRGAATTTCSAFAVEPDEGERQLRRSSARRRPRPRRRWRRRQQLWSRPRRFVEGPTRGRPS